MTRAEALAGAVESGAELARLIERKAELTRQLVASLKLEQFVGRPIFEHGRVRSYVRGNAWSPELATFHLELGNGESLEYALPEVPISLWPAFAKSLEETRPDNYKARRFLAQAKAKESGNAI